MWCGQKRFYLSTSWVEPQNGEKPPYTGKLRYQKAYNREKSSIEEKPIQEGKSDLDVTLLEKSYVVDKLSFAEKRRYTGAPNLVEKCLFLPKPYVVKKSNNEDQKFHEVLDRFEKKLLDERGEHIKVDEEKDKRVVTSVRHTEKGTGTLLKLRAQKQGRCEEVSHDGSEKQEEEEDDDFEEESLTEEDSGRWEFNPSTTESFYQNALLFLSIVDYECNIFVWN